MKRLVIYLLFLSSLMFFSSGIFAVGDTSCSVVSAASGVACPSGSGYMLMRLSDSTNAHGETRDGTA